MSYYESDHCVVDHQNGPGQDFWYLGDNHDGYGAPQWPTREAMIADLLAIVAELAELPPPPVDECPNLYLSNRPAQLLATGGWLNIHPGPPPRDGKAYLTADPPANPWTVIRYDDQGWPSHPDEDLPPENVMIEMWRSNGLEWLRSVGTIRRHEAQGQPTATMSDVSTLVTTPPPDIPDIPTPGGVVWRLA